MLTSISNTKTFAAKEETAVDMLIGCHNRIRHFTSISVRLAESMDHPAHEIAEAAAAVYRYFTFALPLHEADENESLHPRLNTAAAGPLANASVQMVRQHADIDALVAELLPIWDALQRDPHKLAQLAAELRSKSQCLQQLWDTHLTLEEQTVFPAMQRFLPAQELEALRNEMRRRRAG